MPDAGEHYLEFAVETAHAAGEVIREGRQRPIDVQSKGLRNLLTEIDLAAEHTIVDAIHSRYPDHDILTEETPPDQRSSRYRWVIDPLDGTANFSRGYPRYSTSIALTLFSCPSSVRASSSGTTPGGVGASAFFGLALPAGSTGASGFDFDETLFGSRRRRVAGTSEATRNPRWKVRLPGERLPRNADRQILASKSQPPPRYTRPKPVAAPVGSSAGDLA